MQQKRIMQTLFPPSGLGATQLPLVFALFVAGAGCMHADATSPASAAAGEAGAPALEQIERLIGQPRCTSDAQCHVVGIGSRACGGPESFRAWSTLTTRAGALDPPLQAYASERQRWREKTGLMSTCELLPVPRARCERVGTEPGRCLLVLPAVNDLR